MQSINTSKGDASDVGVFSDNSQVTVFESLESADLAYLGWGKSVQKANCLYNKHLSEEIKAHIINISDNYAVVKTWLITNYGGPSKIFGDIVNNFARKPTPVGRNRKDIFLFYLAITWAIQGLEKLSRVNYIDKSELEACLLSGSTISSLVRLLPAVEHDLWVREMTVENLDFENPVGLDTFNCFKKVCVIERNTNEGSRS